MSLTCRVCRRMNPPEAQYCYHDGVALDAAHARGPVAAGAQLFPTPFVLPSGRSCRSFDELVLACETDWDAAKSVLQQGFLEGFLGGLGRVDLAVAARQSAGAPDLDRGLDEVLGKLPSSVREPAKVRVATAEIDLGDMLSGTDQRLTVNVQNVGMGLLQGTVSCAETPWLAVGDAPAGPQKMFQCRQALELPVHVVGKALRANAKPLSGKLIVDTNGGVVEIPVRVQVPVKPFPDGVLGGAKTPRQVAEKAKASPKEAAGLFANGAVADWYASNGWTYPVQGPSATGIGAVQQFFEALGLVAAPKVTISTQSLQFRGAPGTFLEQVIQVQTVEKRPVYAHAVSKSVWLQIGKVQLRGQTANIPLLIPSVPSMPGEDLQCMAEVTANGNQRFTVNVSLTITEGSGRAHRVAVPAVAAAGAAVALGSGGSGPVLEVMPAAAVIAAPPIASHRTPAPPPLPPAPVIAAPPSLPPASPFDFTRAADVEPVHAPFHGRGDREGGGRLGPWKHLLPLLFLLLGLGFMPLHDKWLDDRTELPAPDITEAPEVPIDPKPYLALHFHDTLEVGVSKDMATRLGNATMRFGLVMPREYTYKLTDKSIITLRNERVPEPVLKKLDPLKEKGLGRDAFETELSKLLKPDEMTKYVIPIVENAKKQKQLTFSEYGVTNNTCVRIDGKEYLFGELKGIPAKWVKQAEPLGKEHGREIDGQKSVWEVEPKPGERIVVTQVVEVVPGAPLPGERTRRLDTCLVRYDVKNEGAEEHQVGVRFLLDSYIGGNDGVPFTIPGQAGLCDTKESFKTRDAVPDFIQVLENDDLKDPGTVARVQFRVGKQFDAPDRVFLGGWPDDSWRMFEKVAGAFGPTTRWEVPHLSMRAHEFKQGNKIYKLDPDSSVAIYWDERPLRPRETRKVGFGYGLGSVASQESGGKLLLTVGGQMAIDAELTLTALVQNPEPGDALTLELPAGIELSPGHGRLEESVPPLEPNATRKVSTVTWKLNARKAGVYSLVVKSSKGVKQTVTVQIRPRGVFD